jgi:ribonuclease P protein component
MNETDLSTKRAQTGQDPWIPQADVDQSRAGGDPVASGKGAPPAVGVTADSPPAVRRRPSVDRLRSRRSFEAVGRGASRGRAGPLTVSYLENPSSERPQVAYAIGRHVGGAVDRNRLRRRLRAIVAEQAGSLPVGAYVVRASRQGSAWGFEELKVAMSQAVEKAARGRSGQLATKAAPRLDQGQ